MKAKNLLVSLSILGGLLYVSSCGEGTNNPSSNFTINDIVFEDTVVEYNGEVQDLLINNLPDGWKVTYKGNGNSAPGEYYITATITDPKGNNTRKSAILTIEKCNSVLTAETVQEAFCVNGVGVTPSYTLNNTTQKVVVDNYYKPGVYTVELYAEENEFYKESNHIVVEFTIKEGNELGIIFESKEFEVDGTEKVITASNIPAGYSVEYRNNKGTKQGKYNASCDVFNADNEKVLTLNAILEIDNPKHKEFEEYLDQFFVDYLGNDYIAWNIFMANPSSFGFERDLTDKASWYTYTADAFAGDYLQDSYEGMLESKGYLEEFNKDELSYEQQISYVAIEKLIDSYLEEYNPENDFNPYMELLYIDSYGGYAANFTTYMESYEFRTRQDIEDVISLIESLPEAFASYIIYAEEKTEAGFPYSDYTLNEMISYIDGVVSDENYYLPDFMENRINMVSYLTLDEKQAYISRINDAIENEFMSAHNKLKEDLNKFIGTCSEDKAGYLQDYEKGKEYYVHQLSSLLGYSDFDPEAYGAYLEENLNKYSRKVNDIVKQYQDLNSTDSKAYNRFIAYVEGESMVGIQDPNKMIAYLKEFAKTIVPELKSEPTINIKYMDESVAEFSSAVAYYMKSPLDSDLMENITLNGVTLGQDYNSALSTMAHEGYPGHLYAYVFSKELDISNVAKVMTSTAHAEGWTTYVESQLWEYIKTHNAASNAGEQKAIEIACDYFKYQDLLVYTLYSLADFNIHYNNYGVNDLSKLLMKAGLNQSAAQNVYDSLIESPTTYASYGFGRLHFLQLHEEAQEKLGTIYDEKEFNALILSHGWCSYDELDALVEEYIEEQLFLYNPTAILEGTN